MTTTSPTGITTTSGYDGLGRRNAVTDARTGTSETHYDAKGRVEYVQNAAGRQTTVTDGTGTRVFAYDATSRQLQTETMNGITPAVLTRYYDPAGVKGRSVGMSVWSGYTVGWAFDPTGRFSFHAVAQEPLFHGPVNIPAT